MNGETPNTSEMSTFFTPAETISIPVRPRIIELPDANKDHVEHMEQLIRWVAEVHGLNGDQVFYPYMPADPFGDLKRSVARRSERMSQLVEEVERLGNVSGDLDRRNRALVESAKELERALDRVGDNMRLMQLQIQAMRAHR